MTIEDLDQYDRVEAFYERYEPNYTDSDAFAARSIRPHQPVRPTVSLESEAAQPTLPMTYKPSRFESGWLASSLRPFYEEQLVTDVLYHVKGGKEASVYCCRAAPDLGVPLLAAKVYRPRQFRNLRNDKMYRDGRPILTEGGRPAKKTDHRLLRAVGKKTEFGVQVEHTSWLMYEYTTLQRLHTAGGAVPKPYAASDNAILMGYCGDAHTPAPTLSHVRLDRDEAEPLFHEVVRNMRLMFDLGMIHGDLSAYNILYWDGKVTLIDFPQVTNSEANRSAEFILRRDITRVCEYFASHGIGCDAELLMRDLWRPEEHAPLIDL